MQNLKITKLEKHYNQPLIENINISHSGDNLVALIGDNGCGKSTLLKILAGVESSDGGSADWIPEPRIGYMPQEIADYATLSGGQKKIAVLSELIYSYQYDVLLLDEPDNHLDTEGKKWLVEALKSFSGLVIYISHDRNFLKNTADKVWLMENGTIQTYPFGFSKFQEIYAQDQKDQQHLYKVQSIEKKRLQDYVNRTKARASSGPKAAKKYHAALKRLERFVNQMIEDPTKKDVSINISSQKAGKIIKKKTSIFAHNLCFSYPKGEEVFKSANLHLYIDDKVALIAPNGTGKSTLIKLLLGELQPDSGTAQIGNDLKLGYYSQEHFATLPPQESPLVVFTERFFLPEWEVESILKKFFFTRATMKAKIGHLSGGQRSRLQLALFLYTNPDILILDEPSNHLDIKSIIALENFLKEFHGAIFLISHDQELIKNTCDKIYTVRNKQITPHI